MATLRITDVGGGYALTQDFEFGTYEDLVVTETTSTRFAGFDNTPGNSGESFVLHGTGFFYLPTDPPVPAFGTVTGLDLLVNGNLAASLSGVSIDLPTLLNVAVNGTEAQFFDLFFSGDDSMLGSSFGDELMGFGANDTLNGGGGADRLLGDAGNDSVFGGVGNDTLFGGTGNDTMNGGTGIDRMAGGADNDTYMLDTVGEFVVEGIGQGIDTVRTTLAAYGLATQVENLVATNAIAHAFTGNALANVITGLGGADSLAGWAANDTLAGAGGDDQLDGGTGADRMLGGLNADTYIVDNVADAVVELGNQGIDKVRTTLAAYTLTAHVENLIAGNAIAHVFTGNALDNAIVGSGAADSLAGRAGNDSLSGAAGNDTLIGGAGADTLNGGIGGDQLRINTLAESTTAAADLALGFAFAAGDRVDLRGIDANTLVAGNQDFAYIAGAAFGGLGASSAGELRVVATAAGRYRASGDVNGDGAADFAVEIASVFGPVQGWFLL